MLTKAAMIAAKRRTVNGKPANDCQAGVLGRPSLAIFFAFFHLGFPY
jgi:hypothetical protein